MSRYSYHGFVQDGNGAVVTSATITVYEAGTSTKATIYAAVSGGSAISGSAVTSDASGYYQFFVDDTDYSTIDKFDIEVAKAGYNIANIEDITIPIKGSGYIVDSSEADQGAAGNGNSVKDLVDAIGSSEVATLYFPHHGNAGNTTTYAVSTDETIPDNFYLTIEAGAILSIDSGHTLTIYSPENIQASKRQQIFTGSGSIAFTRPGEIYPQWWGAAADGSTDDIDAINSAFGMTEGSVVYFPPGQYVISEPIVASLSFYGAGSGTTIKPDDNFEAFQMEMAHADSSQPKFAHSYVVSYTDVGSITSAAVAHWFSKNGASSSTAGVNNFSMFGVRIYGAYRGFQQLNTDHGNFWNVSLKNILVWDCEDYGLYLNLTADSGSLGVVIDNFVIDGNSANYQATGKGFYINGLVDLTINAISSPYVAENGTAFYGANLVFSDVRLQIENATASADMTTGLVDFRNSKYINVDLLFQSCEVAVGGGNSMAWVYFDATTTDITVNRVQEYSITETSGTLYKLRYNSSTASDPYLTINDKRILSVDRDFPAIVDITLQSPGQQTGLYDFSVDGGGVGNYTVGYLPDNCIITRAWYEVLTQPTSDGSATIAMGVGTDDATGILTGTAYDNAIFNTGVHDGTPDGTAANFTTKTTAARSVLLIVAGAALTAGKIRMWWEYVESD